MKKVLFGIAILSGLGATWALDSGQEVGGYVLGFVAVIAGGVGLFALMASGARNDTTGETSD